MTRNNTSDSDRGRYHRCNRLLTAALIAMVSLLPSFADNQFSHQTGRSGQPLTSVNGHMMQDAHEYHQVVYAAPGATVTLHRPDYVSFDRYIRWYDYRTDRAAATLTMSSAAADYSTAWGVFYFNNSAELTASLTMGTTEQHIACDQSIYTDHQRLDTYRNDTVVEDGINITLLNYDAIAAMAVGETRTVLLSNPHKNNGYVLGYRNGTIGLGTGFGSEILMRNTVETAATDSAYLFHLTRTATGYSLSTVRGGMTPNQNGSAISWTTAGSTYTLTQATSYGSTSDFMPDYENQYNIRFRQTTYLNAGGGSSALRYAGGTGEWSVWYVYQYQVGTYEHIYRTLESTFIEEPTLSQRLVYDIYPAAEMAARVDASTTDWMEVHNMIAPTGNNLYIGPDHGYSSAATYPAYFCNAASPVSLQSATWTWRADGVAIASPTVSAGRFIRVSSTTEGEVEYTLEATRGGITYRIARFIVTYYDRDQVGPKAGLSDGGILKSAALVTEQRFNFRGTDTFTSNGVNYWLHPLTSAESSYGFYWGREQRKNSGSFVRPYVDEYAFVDRTNEVNWWNGGTISAAGLTNHTLPTDADDHGYMLFVDGSAAPGDLLSINMTADLCPGTEMYFSAYVGDLSTASSSNAAPNLDFQLQGIDDEGQPHVLTTFTTGEFGANATNTGAGNSAEWLRIFFPFRFGEDIDYNRYVLKISNKGKNSSGNDFVIDDIQIYVEQPPVKPIQASSADCPVDDESGRICTYLRVDYSSIQSDDDTYYYQWRDADDRIITADYINGTAGQNSQWGRIHISAPTAANTFSDLLAFDDFYHDSEDPGYGYILEDCGNGTRYVLYIAQPLILTAGHIYTGYVASHSGDLGPGSACGNSASILIAGGTRITVDGDAVTSTVTDLCGNRQYQLNIEMVAIRQDNTTGTLVEDTYRCSADWLYGSPDYVGAHPELYPADYATIRAAIEARQAGTLTAEQQSLISALERLGLLQVDRQRIDVQPITDTEDRIDEVQYTAFPMAGSTESGIPVCTEPRTLTFRIPETEPSAIMIGTQGEWLPQYVANQPRRIRVSNRRKNTGSLSMSVYLIGPRTRYTIEGAVMSSSTYPAWQSLSDTVMQVSPSVITPTTDSITVSGEGLKCLVPGYDYTFYLKQAEGAEDCDQAVTFLTLRIIPDSVTWQPADHFGAWNSDLCWDSFVPTPETNVIISEGDHVLMPLVAHDTLQTIDLEYSADAYISYDINYAPHACHHIYMPGGSLVGQHMLSIGGQLFYDLHVKGGQWTMISLPVQGVVTGDIFTPMQESARPFEVAAINQQIGQSADDRRGHPYYISLFNTQASIVGSGTDITSTGWSLASNTISQQLPLGYGFELGANFSEDAIIRLPKQDTMYRYYRSGAWVNDYETQIQRDANYGKPAFQPTGTEGDEEQLVALHNNTAGNMFLMGNPTLGYIQMDRMLSEGINQGQLTGSYLATGLGTTSRYEHAYVVDGISSDGRDHSLLAPGQAALLQARSAATDIEVSVKPSMLTTSQGEDANDTPRRYAPRRAAASDNRLQRAIYITATYLDSYVSYAVAVESKEASDEMIEGEDAEVLLLDGAMTRFAIYTTVDDHSLAINQFSESTVLPLCLYALRSTPEVQVLFTGHNDYLKEWDLVSIANGERISLCDSSSVTLEMPEDGSCAYQLEHARHMFEAATDIDAVDSETLQATAYQHQLRVTSPAGDIRVYDASGKMVAHTTARSASWTLPEGIYIVRSGSETVKAQL